MKILPLYQNIGIPSGCMIPLKRSFNDCSLRTMNSDSSYDVAWAIQLRGVSHDLKRCWRVRVWVCFHSSFIWVMDGDGECSSRRNQPSRIKSTYLGSEVVTTLQQLSLGMAKWPNGIWVPISPKFIEKLSKNFGRKFYENKAKVHSKTIWIHPFVSSINCTVPGPSKWLRFLRSAGAGSIAVHLTSPLSW